MDLGFLVFSFFAMMISPPGDVRCSAGDAISCPCSAIPPLNLTQPPPETCLEVDSRFRYNCAKGYVRKAGTSNLIKCQNTTGVVKWTEATLQCIPDPKIVPTPPPSPPVKPPTTSLQMTQSISTSASVTAETDSTVPTSSGLQVLSVHTQAAPTTSLQMTQSISTSASVTAETDSTVPTSSGLQVLSVHTQAAPTTSLQMTQSISTSASVTAETDSTVPTSSGLQVLSVHTQAEKAATETRTVAWMTQGSTIAALSQRSTAEPQRHELSSTIARNSIVPLVIICACAGICFYYYKRRTRNMIPVRTSEEDVPMDGIQPQDSVRSQPATAVEGIRLNGDQDCGA
ncbi:interleukin-15 receptor subunit alpha isoform X5 [Acanthopagrus latus]|uniref:interleukin-15 receptor subunit alpha isoform X5 n=1 Tax=Acanthopagrus latus TaxID=8177 RepID=UPI00187C064D|nr:interleukin-15 receptor subunit alpha isoform X5 [Acanthopagrus latus]